MNFQERSCQSKRRYWNEVDAIIAAHKRYADGELSKLRAYDCRLCGGWHLTKSPRMYVDFSRKLPVRSFAMRRMDCCHLFTDGPLESLNGFALSIGLCKSWLQDEPYPHFDLIGPKKRALAIERGAIEVGNKDAIRILRVASVDEST